MPCWPRTVRALPRIAQGYSIAMSGQGWSGGVQPAAAHQNFPGVPVAEAGRDAAGFLAPQNRGNTFWADILANVVEAAKPVTVVAFEESMVENPLSHIEDVNQIGRAHV